MLDHNTDLGDKSDNSLTLEDPRHYSNIGLDWGVAVMCELTKGNKKKQVTFP